MAYIQAPSDNRMANLGNKMSSGMGMIANQMFRQNNMNLQNQLQQERIKQRWEEAQAQRDHEVQQKQSMLDRVYGANAQVPTAQGQQPIFVEGSMNPDNTGLTQPTLNQMKMQAMTGVSAPKAPTQQKPLGYSMSNDNGLITTLNKETGDTKTSGKYRPKKDEKGGSGGTDAKNKRGNQILKDMFSLNQKISGITAGENMNDMMNDGRKTALIDMQKRFESYKRELKEFHPKLYNEKFRTVEKKGKDAQGREVVKYSDGTIEYVK